METIDRDYLENVCTKLKAEFPAYNFSRGERMATNVYNLGNGTYYFQIHNFLPDVVDDILEGHYTIVVNANNFNYFIFQHAYFGSLSYTTEAKDKNVYFKEELPKNSRARMDFNVADYLLGSYFYCGKHINHQGKNLFPTAYCLSDAIMDYDTREKRGCIFDRHDWETIQDEYTEQIKKLVTL